MEEHRLKLAKADEDLIRKISDHAFLFGISFVMGHDKDTPCGRMLPHVKSLSTFSGLPPGSSMVWDPTKEVKQHFLVDCSLMEMRKYMLNLEKADLVQTKDVENFPAWVK